MNFDLLAGLSDTDRRAVAARMVRRSFRKGETLFHEGDPGDSLHLIEKGRIAIRPSICVAETGEQIEVHGRRVGRVAANTFVVCRP